MRLPFVTIFTCLSVFVLSEVSSLACSVIYAKGAGEVLAGNNEDYSYPNTIVSFFPREKGKHGAIVFGFDHFWMQGGVNDQGLFFDGLAVNRKTVPIAVGT